MPCNAILKQRKIAYELAYVLQTAEEFSFFRSEGMFRSQYSIGGEEISAVWVMKLPSDICYAHYGGENKMKDHQLITFTSTRIRELRQELGWSQAELARRLKVGATTVRQWENAMTLPSTDSLIALCEVLCIQADYLLGITDSKAICLSRVPPQERERCMMLLKAFIQSSTLDRVREASGTSFGEQDHNRKLLCFGGIEKHPP